MPELPPRPGPPRSVRESIAAWLAWFGPARLVTTTVAVVVVAGGGWLLVRTPPPSAEAELPVTSGSAPVATLPLPARADDPATVLVHVAGAVVAPGVYEVATSVRVVGAIDAAGGPADDAELDSLNLAAPVADGERIYVPVVGEVVTPADGPGATGGATAPSLPIDLNTADAGELEQLPGIGPATAAAIVRHRDEHGPFASVDDLTAVNGIGPAKLAAIRGLVRV